MNKGICLQTVLFGLTILGIFMILKNNKEGFSDLGIYPESVIKGLLYPSYKMKNNPGLSNLNMQKAYKLYPTYAVGSYAQVTNNKRYWDSPCNGLTTPPDMCGGLYQEKHCDQSPIIPPKKHCLRVNYYCSN